MNTALRLGSSNCNDTIEQRGAEVMSPRSYRHVMDLRIAQRVLVPAIFGFIFSIVGSAGAQSADIAATLFQRARAQMQVNDFAAACPLLDESYRQDPKLGTLFTLANCRDREGKLGTARGRYSEYVRGVDRLEQAAERNRHSDRRAIAEKRVKELEREVPTLQLVWQGGFPKDVSVRIDNVAVATVALSIPLPFDPGQHAVVIQRAGYIDFTRNLELAKGSRMTVDVSTWPLEKSPTAPERDESSGDPDAPRAARFPMRKLGYALLGVGGAGLVFGTIMGALTLSEKQTVTEHCHGPRGYDCDATGFSAVTRMRTYATPSTIGFIVGGVLATAGGSLVIFAPTLEKGVAVRLHVQGNVGQGFVGIEGAF